MNQLNKLYNSHQYYSFRGQILSTKDSIYYIECHKDGLAGYFYSEKTNRIIGGNITSTLKYNDSAQMEFYQYPIASNDNEFISIISPKQFGPLTNILCSEKLSKALEGFNSNSNPILVFYKLKNF
jgi:hypothetical protein